MAKVTQEVAYFYEIKCPHCGYIDETELGLDDGYPNCIVHNHCIEEVKDGKIFAQCDNCEGELGIKFNGSSVEVIAAPSQELGKD